MPAPARAEGTDQLNLTQALRARTQLYVDIVAPGTESIRWQGVGTVDVTLPDGTALATLGSGETVGTADLPAGAYGVYINRGQVVDVRWDVQVVGQTGSGGRLHSYDWAFNAGAFSESRATNGSFYALVPGGSGDDTAVIELKLDGLAGYVFNINANRIGVDGPDGGRSVSMYGHTVTPEFPIYLTPPTLADFAAVTPEVYGLDYIGGRSVDVNEQPMDPCNVIAPGESFGRFQFFTPNEGTYHLQCDLDGDGVFEMANDDDFLAIGTTTPGVNTVLWDGIHQGNPIAEGTYECRVRLNVGEFHYVGADIETSYQGMRMFEVKADGSRRSLTMFWNDLAVQDGVQNMPGGAPGLPTSGEDGIESGPYSEPAVANVNARSWGAFNSGGKGNMNYLDTHTVLASSTSSNITLQAVSATADDDSDGLSNFEEQCVYGTNPQNPDSDGDGTTDGEQWASNSSSGGTGGLESNGRLSSKLARRAIAKSLERAAPVAASPLILFEAGELSGWLDTVSLPGLTAVPATPTDLPELTNADEVFGLDFVDGNGSVRASALLISSEGAIYEHSKALCDRAGGSELLELGLAGNFDLLRASYRSTSRGTLDHASTLKLYDQGDDRMSLHAHWNAKAYPAVAAGQRVVNVQLWARQASVLGNLQDGFFASLAAKDALVVEAAQALDESNADTWTRPTRERQVPPFAFASGRLFGGELELEVLPLLGSATGGHLVLRPVSQRGQLLPNRRIDLGADAFGERGFRLSLPLYRDLHVDLYEGNTLVDTLWLSDGAWAPFDDGLWDGTTEVTGFSVNDCPLSDPTSQPWAHDGLAPLAGCAQVRAGRVDRFAGVARHFARGISTATARGFVFHYRSSDTVEVCVEDNQRRQKHCRKLPASPQGQWAQLDGFGPVQTANLLTFTRSTAGELVVGGLALNRQALELPSDRVRRRGCSAASRASGSPCALLALLGLLVMRRRRR